MKFNFKRLLTLLLLGIILISGASCKSCKKDPKPNPIDPEEPEIVEPSSIEIITERDSISINEELKFSARVLPEGAKQEVDWEITQLEEYATFENNVLKGKKQGKVFITCTCKENKGISATKEIQITHPLIEDEEYRAYNIIGAFGEDASTSFSISYHAKNTKTFVLVTEEGDVDFANAKKFTSNGYYFEDLDEKIAGKFEGRNIYKINVTGLKPNTKYMYKVSNGDDSFSEIFHFKTADGGNKTTFLFNTDTHYSMFSKDNGISTAVNNDLVDAALKINPDISFILDTGDLIDTGGNQNIWEKFFTLSTAYKQLPFVSCPGNHEYYVSSTLQKDNRYFAAHHASPLNGSDKLKGVDCYFHFNDVLFIMMDNNRHNAYYEQYAWLENLLATEDYKYSVVCFHSPIEGDNGDPKLVKLFEKYSVDLVLDGHYHVHNYRQYLYQGVNQSEEALKGVTYLTGACSGDKGFHGKTHEEALEFVKGYIITIDDDGIHFQMINGKGETLQTFNMSTRKKGEKKETTKDEIMNKLDMSFDKEKSQVKFTWDDTYYLNVKRVTVEETLRNVLTDYSVCPTPAYQDLTLDKIEEGYQYKFKVTVKFSDDTEQIKYFDLDLHKSINLTIASKTDTSVVLSFDPTNESMLFMIKEYRIYVNGTLFTSTPYVTGITPVSSFEVYGLEKGKEYEIRFDAISYSDTSICYSESIKFTL